MRDLENALVAIRNAWVAGRPALDHCPAAWREVMDGTHGELALLALAAHFTEVLTRQAPGTPLEPRPPLPPLSAPSLPDALRPRFRRLLSAKGAMSPEQPLVAFVTARGYAAHPGDWMPGPKDDWAPEIYAPWLDWVRAASAPSAAPDDEITADNYGDWPWSERRKALERLRAANPAAARTVMAAKLGTEPVDHRVRLVELLQIGLGADDIELLEGLAKDRSERVQALARACLARLGHSTDDGTLAAELAQMVEVEKVGLIHRRSRLGIKALKNGAQASRRRELFHLVSLTGLARALGVSEGQLVEGPPAGVAEGIEAFVVMVAATGSDEALRALLAGLLAERELPVAHVLPLAARLPLHERRALLPQVMRRDTEWFDTALAFAGPHLGEAPLETFLASPAFVVLREHIEGAVRGEDAVRAGDARVISHIILRAGLLLDADGARELLARIASWGLSPADPALDMLHFNAALTPET